MSDEELECFTCQTSLTSENEVYKWIEIDPKTDDLLGMDTPGHRPSREARERAVLRPLCERCGLEAVYQFVLRMRDNGGYLRFGYVDESDQA